MYKKFEFGSLFLQINGLKSQGSFGININYDITKPTEKYNGRFEVYFLIGLVKYQLSFGIDYLIKNKLK